MARDGKPNKTAGKKNPGRQPRQNSVSGDILRGKKPGSGGTGLGWKWPIVFALVAALAAGGSLWWKLRGHGAPGSPSSQAPASEASTAAAAAKALANAPTFPDNTGPEAGYVGAASCKECHQGISESFSHIAMGRSTYPPTAENIIEDYDTHHEIFHEPSGMYFRMSHEGGKFFQTSFQKDLDGKVTNENKVQVSYIVGSGNNSRSYVHREPDGKMYQLPVAWYTQEKKWAMNPGYDSAEHINFSRRITYDCMFCHAAIPDLKPGEDQSNYGESSFFPEHLEAIDCERCHGPAQKHVTLARQGAAAEAVKASIVNTGNLSNQLQLEVCMQCHLETTSGNLPHSVHAMDKGIFGYRPGEPLEDYRYAFNHPAGTGHDDKFEIAGQAYRMRMSPCFIQSEGRMTCTTCHDPHRVPKDKITAAIQSCLECHKPADCIETMDVRLPVKDNCIQCHMPRRRTDDVVHVVMTDHYIQRRPPPAEQLLAPKKEKSGIYRGDIVAYYPAEIGADKRDLYMGLAYIANSANLQKGVGYLDAVLNKASQNFPAVYTRGVALKMLGQMDASRQGLEQAVKLRPDHPQAWMALADLYEQMRNYPRSIECYQMATQLDPRLSRAQNGLGTSYLLSKDLAGAEKAFKTAITLDPFDDNPHLNLSGLYLQRSDFAGAEAEARAALAVNPNRPAGWVHLATCALETGKAAEGIWPALEAVKLDGADLHNGEVLIMSCKSAGPGAALPILLKAKDRAPFAAQVMAAQVYLAQGDMTAAGTALQTASGATTAPAIMAAAVQAALDAQRADLALLWGEQVLQAIPDNEEAAIACASAFRATGQESRAEALLNQWLTRGRTPRVLNAMAWLKATATDNSLRSGADATKLVSEAINSMGQQNVFLLQTQAAAQAESGNIAQAEAMAGEALAMAQNAGLKAEARKIEAQLKDYKAGRPHRAKW